MIEPSKTTQRKMKAGLEKQFASVLMGICSRLHGGWIGWMYYSLVGRTILFAALTNLPARDLSLC